MRKVSDIVSEVRRLLQDEVSPYRYSDDEMLDGVFYSLQEVLRARPDLFIGYDFHVPTITLADPTPLPDIYLRSLVYLIAGHISMKDDENVLEGRAAGLRSLASSQLIGGG